MAASTRPQTAARKIRLFRPGVNSIKNKEIYVISPLAKKHKPETTQKQLIKTLIMQSSAYGTNMHKWANFHRSDGQFVRATLHKEQERGHSERRRKNSDYQPQSRYFPNR